MLALGKRAGFHSGKIQSYFTRPDRNVNPARIYDIIDGKIGSDIPSASETELHEFISAFETIPTADDRPGVRIPRMPPPAYLGVVDAHISLLPRTVAISEEDEDDFRLRSTLLDEQRRVAIELAEAWSRFQVDQQLARHLTVYASLAVGDHRALNIFSLDTEFHIVGKSLGPDTGGLGEKGEIQWERFAQNHIILCNLYPEMRAYRNALASMKLNVALPEKEAYQVTNELSTDEMSEFVREEVPAFIRERLDEEVGTDVEASQRRTYDVASLISKVATLFRSLVSIVTNAQVLWDRLWPILREFFRQVQGYF